MKIHEEGSLKLFGIDQYVGHVGKDEQGDDEQEDHRCLDFFKPVDGGVDEPKAEAGKGEEGD